MIIDFDEREHCYSINGDIAAVSVTELLRKHGLAPNYDAVSEDWLKAKAEEGKAVHKDLENVLNKAEYTPTTWQGEAFKQWADENLECGVGEQMLGYSDKGLTIGGTADVMGFLKDGSAIVADHKNTAAFHREYVTWQVNVLDYFARHINGKINDKPFHWKGAKKFFCFHYGKDKALSVKELTKIDDAEIERLLECEYNGEIYQRALLAVDPELQAAVEQAEQALIEIEAAQKAAEAQSDELRAKLCALMEQQKVYKWETDKVSVTYVAQSDRLTVDSTKLKRELPQVYEKYAKISKIKAHLLIKAKGGDEEDE